MHPHPHGVHHHARRGRDAGHALQEVERHSLRCQQAASWTARLHTNSTVTLSLLHHGATMCPVKKWNKIIS